MGLMILLCSFAALCLSVAGVFYTRHKFRLLWSKQDEWQRKYDLQQQQLIELKKAITLKEIESLRLPAKMPSQHGEDVLLGQFFDFKASGFFVEVGAFDGVELSNSYFFEALGWEGILIEPNPNYFKQYAEKRPYSRHINAAVLGGDQDKAQLTMVADAPALSYSETSVAHRSRVEKVAGNLEVINVDCVKLSDVLKDYSGDIDFISIDVEGAELSVLQTLDFDQHRPAVFVIEDNSAGKDSSVSDFLGSKGYEKRFLLGCNDFYLAKDDTRELKLTY